MHKALFILALLLIAGCGPTPTYNIVGVNLTGRYLDPDIIDMRDTAPESGDYLKTFVQVCEPDAEYCVIIIEYDFKKYAEILEDALLAYESGNPLPEPLATIKEGKP